MFPRKRSRRSGSDIEVREKLIARLFAREVYVADRVLHLPPMQIRQATRLATGDWEVELVPTTGDEAPMTMEFQRPERHEPRAA
jgi:hypothetical protein